MGDSMDNMNNIYKIIYEISSLPGFWLSLVLAPVTSLLPDVVAVVIMRYCCPTDHDIIQVRSVFAPSSGSSRMYSSHAMEPSAAEASSALTFCRSMSRGASRRMRVGSRSCFCRHTAAVYQPSRRSASLMHNTAIAQREKALGS